ncbi:MAG: glycosyl transferase, partial [Acidobacteria bacterium]
MYNGQRISAVIPAHDEARHVAQVINTVPGLVDHVIVVDDCSQDDTFHVAAACGDPRLIVLQTPAN